MINMSNIFTLMDRKNIPKEFYYKDVNCKYYEHNFNMQYHHKGYGLCHNLKHNFSGGENSAFCTVGHCKYQEKKYEDNEPVYTTLNSCEKNYMEVFKMKLQDMDLTDMACCFVFFSVGFAIICIGIRIVLWC